MYQPLPEMPRIASLREAYSKGRVASFQDQYSIGEDQSIRDRFYYASDRLHTIPFMKGWLKYQKLPTTVLRRSYTEAYVLDQMQPIVEDGELIVGQPDLPLETEAEQKELDALIEAFRMSPHIDIDGRADHLSLDYDKLLRLGLQGMIDEIEERKGKLDLLHGEDIRTNTQKDEFYEGCLVELRALVRMAERYAQHARELAASAEAARAAELEEIARVLDRVPRYPARTFREALQSVNFYTFNLTGCVMAGRPDRYLYPYYQHDLERGIITQAQAQELVDNFCLHFRNRLYTFSTCGIALGGIGDDGELVENDLTYMFLTSASHFKYPIPTLGLTVTPKTSDALIAYALKINADGFMNIVFFNDEAISQSLLRHGVDEKDIHNHIHAACVEISVCGKTNMWTTCPWVNALQLLLDVLHENLNCESTEKLLGLFRQAVKRQLEEIVLRFNRLFMERERNGCEPLRLSCLVDDCIREGRGLYNGGAKYRFLSPAYVGISNVIESIAVIDSLIFQQERMTLRELMEIVDQDFEGNESLRRYIIEKIPSFGTNDVRSNAIAEEVYAAYVEESRKFRTYRGGTVVPGSFAYHLHTRFGKVTQASPDGRKAGESLANGTGPVQGRDSKGITSRILSTAHIPQAELLGGASENFRIQKSLLLRDEGRQMIALMRTFMHQGCVQMQINVVDAQTLEDAMEHPEQYAELQVRVGGYCDFFTRMPRYMQKEIAARTMLEG